MLSIKGFLSSMFIHFLLQGDGKVKVEGNAFQLFFVHILD
jgi:hypothetical protein